MIRFENAGKRFEPRRPGTSAVEALRDVTLDVAQGGVLAIVGPNGAGKTTLFSLLLGFIRPTAGHVSVDGMAPRDYARDVGVAYLPERFELPARWTVRDALLAFARLEGLKSADAEAVVQRELERWGLGPHARKPIGALSRGLLQRTGLAQAGLGDRPLLVLDEPTQGLDPLWRVRLRERIAELRAEGRTVLLASHELDEVERLADRAALLEDGALREVVDLAPRHGAPLRYLLRTDAPRDAVVRAFTGARAHGTGRGAPAYTIEVEDAHDLSRRLAALLELGATVHEVRPRAGDLEARVRGSGRRGRGADSPGAGEAS